jgi:hypothetical protein
MAPNTVLVMGDITLDLAVTVGANFPQNHAPGADVSFAGSPAPALGGTAMLFAKAAQQYQHVRPIPVAGLGDDKFAPLVLAEAEAASLDMVGLQIIQGTSTCVVSISHFTDGTRFMIRPNSHAGRHIDSKRLRELLSDLNQDEMALVFVSGYLLAEPTLPSVLAVQEACGWARSRNVPIVVDLVPHAFQTAVGDLDTVAKRIGCRPDGYVAELQTVRDLGLCEDYSDQFEARSNMIVGSAALAKYGEFGVVQHQDRSGRYAQAATWNEKSDPLEFFPFTASERTGLGDRLLLHALNKRGYLGN